MLRCTTLIFLVLPWCAETGEATSAADDKNCRSKTTVGSWLLQTKRNVKKAVDLLEDDFHDSDVYDGTGAFASLEEFQSQDVVSERLQTDEGSKRRSNMDTTNVSSAGGDLNADDDAIADISFAEPDLFNAMDNNKDGKVTRGEYNAAMKKLGGKSSPSPSSPGASPAPPSAPSPSGGGSQGKKPTTIPDRWVNAHNYWRCIHGSPPIAWDENFARGAQKWADRGSMSHAQSYKIPAPEGPAGENLASGSHLTLEGAVDMWHDENPERGPRCGGHCTAMLWKAGKKLGCGTGKSGMGHLYVCRYGGGNPLPNFGGRGNYDANVGFPDNSKKDACKRKWPLGEGASPGGSPSGGGGSGRGRGGSGRDRGGSGRGRGGSGRRGWR